MIAESKGTYNQYNPQTTIIMPEFRESISLFMSFFEQENLILIEVD